MGCICIQSSDSLKHRKGIVRGESCKMTLETVKFQSVPQGGNFRRMAC